MLCNWMSTHCFKGLWFHYHLGLHVPEDEGNMIASCVGYLPSDITSYSRRLQFLTINFCTSIELEDFYRG